jgi:hypothetical protein
VKAIYDSGFHHPFLAYLGGAALLFCLVRRLPFLHGFLVVFVVEILADATVTGAWSPIPSASALYQPFAILFVILGDLRYFVLAEYYTRPGASFGKVFAVSSALSLVVPVVTGLGSRFLPALAHSRVLFLVYEVMLLSLVLALQLLAYRRRDGPHPTFVRAVSAFVAVQYAGWALADVLILSGLEVGHLLRIVPNALYYAAFLPYVLWAASRTGVRS